MSKSRKKNKNIAEPEITEKIENLENLETVESVESAETVESAEIIEPVEFVETIETAETVAEAEIAVEPPENQTQSQTQSQTHEKNDGGAFKFKDTILGTTVILMIICVVTALILALLNSLTSPIIEQRLSDEKNEAVAELFGDRAEAEILTGFEDMFLSFDAPVTEAAVIKDKVSHKLMGYCVTVAPQGFSGEIIMFVAVNPNITVKDTKILSMSETSGIGTKITSEDWFGEQFRYKTKNIKDSKADVIPAGENSIKTIAGATRSSKAFLNGVNAALAVAEEIKKATQSTEPQDGYDDDEFDEYDDDYFSDSNSDSNDNNNDNEEEIVQEEGGVDTDE